MAVLPEDEEADQRAEALKQKEAFQSLTTNPGWIMLREFMESQICERTDAIILQPSTGGLKQQLETEYSKGEIHSFKLLMKVAEVGLEEATAVVRSLDHEHGSAADAYIPGATDDDTGG
jgi:hypothetical protein